MMHDKRKLTNWSDKIDNWEQYDGDIILSPHAGFDDMVGVCEIDTDAEHDCITYRGVFWEDKDAEVFAELLDSEITSNNRLYELVERWRKRDGHYSGHNKLCADELEAVIDDE